MLEIVGVGDLHFDKLEKTLPGIGNRLVAYEMQKPMSYALKNGIEHCWFYGDIDEFARMSHDAYLTFKRVLFDPKYRSLKRKIILGNHDFDEQGRHSLELILEDVALLKSYGVDSNIEVFIKTDERVIDGVPVLFLPYPDTKTSKKHVNVGHFEVAGSTRDNGRRIKEGVETEHFCLLGHLHTPHRIGKCYYSGTLYQTNFGESLPKSFHHVKIKSDLQHKVLNVPNDPRYKLFNLEVNSRSDLRKISGSKRDLYKLFVQDGVKINADDLNKYPNVIKLNRFKDEKDLKVQLDEEWKVENVSTVFQPEEDVEKFLSTKNVSKDMEARVLKIHRQFLKRSGFIGDEE